MGKITSGLSGYLDISSCKGGGGGGVNLKSQELDKGDSTGSKGATLLSIANGLSNFLGGQG